jgi:hypothetical protein
MMHTDGTFVSYSRSDSEFALRLASDLRSKGAAVWLDQLDIEAGARWDSAIEGALRGSARILVLLSPKAVASQNVLDEVSFALDEGKTVVPILVETCAIPMRLRRLQYVDFTRDYQGALTRLLGTLGVARPAAASSAHTEPSSTQSKPREPERQAEGPPSAPPSEPPSSYEPFSATTAATPSGGDRRLVWGGAGIAAVAVVVVAVVLLRGGGSSDTPSDTLSDAQASVPSATTQPADEPTASQPTPSTFQRLPASPQPARPAPQADGGNQGDRLKMAPAGMPGGSGTMIGGLIGGTAEQSVRRADDASDADLQTLLSLTRRLSSRPRLLPSELGDVADAQTAACTGQAPTSACSTTASNAVDSMLDSVCGRLVGPAPSGTDEFARLAHDTKMAECRRPYLNLMLERMDMKAREAIRFIKPG